MLYCALTKETDSKTDRLQLLHFLYAVNLLHPVADRLHNASKVNMEQNLEGCAIIAVLLIYNQLLSAIDVIYSLYIFNVWQNRH